ncbi:hypothetical protein VLK31_06220 [Variovorax sp. H27-G14]|uniref:hypothetical protein n=1 Tax=Variovorax sp. H27-G14 TaxID=3111914 RepID=UPI0038FC201E
MPVVMRGLEGKRKRGVAQCPCGRVERCCGGVRPALMGVLMGSLMRALMGALMQALIRVPAPVHFIAAMGRLSAALVVGFTRIPSSIEVRQFYLIDCVGSMNCGTIRSPNVRAS